MANSQNGWSVNPPLDNKNVPGTSVKLAPGVRQGDVATVLFYVAEQFNKRVEKLTAGWNWGYANRAVRGSTSTSNHASGTAIDLNAPKHPLGTNPTANYSAAQINTIRAILRECEGTVRWGGDYSGRKDPMHFEINANSAAVNRVAKKLRGGVKPTVSTPAPVQRGEGIDVYSAYQKVTNWKSVRNAGKRFVYIKVSDGTTTRSDAGYARGAKAAGLYAGGYHYAQFGDPIRQANILVDRCLATGATDLAPCLDLESPFTPNQTAVDFAIRFLKQVKARGFRPCIYANNSMMSFVGPRVRAAVPDVYLWVARYASLTSTTKLRPSTAYDLHQYSQAGHVPGISASSVDLNDGIIPLNKTGSVAKPAQPKPNLALYYSEDYPMQMPKGGKVKPGGASSLAYTSVTIPSVLREHDLVIAPGVGYGLHIEQINTWKYITRDQAQKRMAKSVSKPGGVGSLIKKAWVHQHAALSLVIPKGVGKIDIAFACDGPWSLSISPRGV